MLTFRRIAPAVRRRIDTAALGNLGSTRLLSTPIPKIKNSLFEKKEPAKFVISNANLIQAATGNTDPKEGNANYVANPVGRLFQATVHKAREVRHVFTNCLPTFFWRN